jgi:hypothetical protein
VVIKSFVPPLGARKTLLLYSSLTHKEGVNVNSPPAASLTPERTVNRMEDGSRKKQKQKANGLGILMRGPFFTRNNLANKHHTTTVAAGSLIFIIIVS